MKHCNFHSLLMCIYHTITVFLTLHTFHFANGQCPDVTPKLKRLNNTRFYIVQEKSKWSQARQKCVDQGLQLAQIDSVGEDATIGRALEITTGGAKNLPVETKNQHYWIEGKFSSDKRGYVNEDGELLNYHNILYRGVRAVGYGQQITDNGTEIKQVVEGPAKCLVYGINFYRSDGKLSIDEGYVGFETRMDEKVCEDDDVENQFYTLCDADKTGCPNEDDSNPDRMTDAKDYYLEEGNWIFGNPRRFMVNWKPRTKEESVKYCKTRDMVLYRPSEKDGCIIPYLALWNREITTANFWTDTKYSISHQTYFFPNGEKIEIGHNYADATTRSNIRPRIGENIFVCVMSAYSYEPYGYACECEWNSMILAPANCGLKLSTICQHVDDKNNTEGSCGQIWGSKNEVYTILNDDNNRLFIVNKTHTIPFQSRSPYAEFYRSTYKQPWGPRLCPRGYSLATTETYIPSPDEADDYLYDGQEDYWVAEKDRGFYLKGNQCTLSKYDDSHNKRNIVKDVDCNEWHFYICEKTNKDSFLRSKNPGSKTKKG